MNHYPQSVLNLIKQLSRLPGIGHVNNLIRFLLTNSITNRRHIGGVVIVAPIAFLNNQRKRFAILVFKALGKNTPGPFRYDNQVLAIQLFQRLWNEWIVERLAFLLDLNVEQPIDFLKLSS